MINSIRSGNIIQHEINDLELLKQKITAANFTDRFSLLITEIETIINTLNWVGSVEPYPTPSKHIKEFIYKKTQVIL